MVVLRRISNEYAHVRMWDDDMNRDRLLALLNTRFSSAANVLTPEEIRRNNGYIDRIIYENI